MQTQPALNRPLFHETSEHHSTPSQNPCPEVAETAPGSSSAFNNEHFSSDGPANPFLASGSAAAETGHEFASPLKTGPSTSNGEAFVTPPKAKALNSPEAVNFIKAIQKPQLSRVMLLLGPNRFAFTGSVAMHIHAHALGQPAKVANRAIGDADVIVDSNGLASLGKALFDDGLAGEIHPEPKKFEVDEVSVDVIKSKDLGFGDLTQAEYLYSIPVMSLDSLIRSKQNVVNESIMSSPASREKAKSDLVILTQLLEIQRARSAPQINAQEAAAGNGSVPPSAELRINRELIL